MKKGYVGLLACASGILIGLGISRLDLTGYLEKTQEQEYHPVERKVPESVESKLKDPKQCWLCGSDERSMMDYFRKFDDLGVICTNHWYVMDMHIRNHDEDGKSYRPAGKRAYGLYRDRRRRLLFPYGADVGLRDFRSIGGLRGR